MDCLLITTEARNQGILMSQFRGNRYIKYIADLPKLGLGFGRGSRLPRSVGQATPAAKESKTTGQKSRA